VSALPARSFLSEEWRLDGGSERVLLHGSVVLQLRQRTTPRWPISPATRSNAQRRHLAIFAQPLRVLGGALPDLARRWRLPRRL